MLDATDVKNFFLRNDSDLNRILIHKHVYVVEDRDDIKQEFYLAVTDSSALCRYDSSRGSYDNYVCGILDHCISKHFRNILLTEQLSEHPVPENQAWDMINDFRNYLNKGTPYIRKKLLTELDGRIKGDGANRTFARTFLRYVQAYKNDTTRIY